MHTTACGRARTNPSAFFGHTARQSEAPDWGDIAGRLSRYAYWEFEDFHTSEEAEEDFRRFLEKHGVDVVRYKRRRREELQKAMAKLSGPHEFTGKQASEIRRKLLEEFGLPGEPL